MVNPKGRPPKLAEDEKRTRAVNLRLNAEEGALLDQLTLRLRCSSGEVLRRGLLELAKQHPHAG